MVYSDVIVKADIMTSESTKADCQMRTVEEKNKIVPNV